MKNGHWMTAKDVLRVNAFKWPDKIGIKDLYKARTFKEWDDRSCRLANALADMGMKKGDRFAVLAYNCVEWMEFYAAAAKGGFICVPLMFRLSAGNGIQYQSQRMESLYRAGWKRSCRREGIPLDRHGQRHEEEHPDR